MGQLIRSRGRLWLGAASAALLLSALVWRSASPRRAAADTPGWEAESTVRSEASTRAAQAPAGAAGKGEDEGKAGSEQAGDEAPPGAVPLAYPVDLAALRAKLPDNLYWQLGAPTEDAAVLAVREEEERRMNDLFGKVQSGTASEEEIHRYHERRKEISEDYIEFASLVLEEHGAELPERDRGLYALSIDMHRDRLRALPRQSEDALARKRARDQRRAERRGETR